MVAIKIQNGNQNIVFCAFLQLLITLSDLDV